MITKIATDGAPGAIGPYVQGVVCGGMLYTSGQIALDPHTGSLTGGDIARQTERVMKNLCAILAQAGCTTENVVKTTCFLRDMADFAAFNEVYAKYITSAARSCVAVRELPKGALVEVEAVAELPAK